MEPAPPKAIEAAVGLLIPPACREDVLGDLHERYACPRQYIVDAVCTVPLVIVSRIRRTLDPQLFLMEALALYISFLAAAWQLDRTFLYEQSGFLRLAIPAAVAVVVLMLGNAYASPGKRSPLKPIREAALAIGFALLSQAALFTTSRELVVPHWILISGSGMSLLLVFTLRMLFPPGATRSRGATANGPLLWQDQVVEAGEPVSVAAIIMVAVFRSVHRGHSVGHVSAYRALVAGADYGAERTYEFEYQNSHSLCRADLSCRRCVDSCWKRAPSI